MLSNKSLEIFSNSTETNKAVYDADRLSDNAYFAIGVYLSIVGTLSITGNGFVVFVLLRGKAKFYKVYGKLVLNLAISDLLLSVVEFPITSMSNFYGRYILPDVFCSINGFWVFTMALVDMDTLAAVAICRYITACKHQFERFLNDVYSKRILLVIWGYAIFWSAAPLIGWNTYTKEAFGTSCTINWTGSSIADKTYSGIIVFTCYFVHLVVFIFCYSNIITSFRKASTMKLNSDRQTGSVKIETVLWYHKIITSRQMTVLSLAMVGTYVLAWTPYAVLTMYVIFISKVPSWVHVIPTMLAKSACLSNPIVYILTSSKFRQAAVNLFRSKQSRVAPATIQLTDEPPFSIRAPDSEHRCYRGDMTSRGIYIGRQQIRLPVEQHVF